MRLYTKIIAGLFTIGTLIISPSTTFAENSIADEQDVPEDIYTWVQSTDRANYYFNHEQISYYVDENGYIDLDTLLVPALCIYDEVQIEDVVTKRRWQMKSRTGYDKLVGRADYLTFKLNEGTVQVTERVDLDDKWGTLDTDKSGQPVELSSLSTNGVECKFYRAILIYAKKHNEDILQHSWGALRPEDQNLPSDEMPLMKMTLP